MNILEKYLVLIKKFLDKFNERFPIISGESWKIEKKFKESFWKFSIIVPICLKYFL